MNPEAQQLVKDFIAKASPIMAKFWDNIYEVRATSESVQDAKDQIRKIYQKFAADIEAVNTEML